MLHLLFTLLALSAPADAAPQTPEAAPKQQPEITKAFDFWIGEWDTTMSNVPDWKENTGHDVIQRHLKDSLIEEIFTRDPEGENFQRAYLFYLKRAGKWQHTIYDPEWGEFRFLGGPGQTADGKPAVVLESAPDDGRPGKRRETFSNITEDSFDYLWEQSNDEGQTWQPMWKVHYQVAKASAEK